MEDYYPRCEDDIDFTYRPISDEELAVLREFVAQCENCRWWLNGCEIAPTQPDDCCDDWESGAFG